MRLIGTVEHEANGIRFSAYLKRQGIENSVDPSLDSTSKQFLYSIWIHNEDQIEAATALLASFQTNPQDRRFDVPITDQIQSEEENPPPEVLAEARPFKPMHATSFFLALCCFVFFLNWMQAMSLEKEKRLDHLITPIQTILFYDVPPFLEATQQDLAVVENTPFWRGVYTWSLLKIKKQDPSLATGPLFAKIRQGEVWRLFSPAILHVDLLHLLFNMLWLWMLGRQIEQRIGFGRYIVLTFILGIATNTAQYLMSGPFFFGYSGIVMGLAGFIWYREKIAPWEGYPLQKSVIFFLGLFILAMTALQLGSLLMILFSSSTFNPNIANTAHIAGAIFGALLARLSYFSARPSL